MKILFFGDSITDMRRNRNVDFDVTSYGCGYVKEIFDLLQKDGNHHQIVNRGISGNRVVDLYARVKLDVWNQNPDVLTILIGINDIWHEITDKNGVELPRFTKAYDMLLQETLERLPNVKIILCEPFVLHGSETTRYWEKFCQVKDYAKVVETLAQKYNLYYLPLQGKFDQVPADYLVDGVHPAEQGAKLIANEWLKLFNQYIQNQGE